ncbi:autotransporter outer membrane beta-barrel domain-containing protein [Bradyrhizobium iriomotense]|uniref:autotransporter outer membrane beta-barrel domain-containing protein n=1 Tax=Bradyrhizobium iriomotense TaxID=441950 RepID=UPI001B8A60ED|nr:autotransporter domain-containing protein [Bradyrhizobium iriomotense]
MSSTALTPVAVSWGTALVALSLLSAPVFAGDAVWNGADSNWNAAANWSTNPSVPSAADNATIDANSTYPVISSGEAYTVNNLYLGVGEGTVGQLIIHGGGTLTVATEVGIGLNKSATGFSKILVTGSGSRLDAASVIVGDGGFGSLQVLSGATLTATTVMLGHETSALGTSEAAYGFMAVSGATATISGNMYVGSEGQGELSVASGAVVTVGGGLLVGVNAGSEGSVTIGSGSSLTANFMTVGVDGEGELLVTEAGSNVTVGGASIGQMTGSGAVTITNGATLTVTTGGTIGVGVFGSGLLTVSDGGKVIADVVSVGSFAGSEGAVNVTGSGSSLNSASTFFVGDSGTGQLAVSQGAAVGAVSVRIGANTGGAGAVTVDGAGTSVVASNSIVVGESGTGTLSISNGGTVTSPVTYVGAASGGVGTLTVDGAGSTLLAPGAGGVAVGYSGNGTLVVSNGGAVTTGVGVIGWFSGSVGTVTIDGSGSSLAVTSSLEIGSGGNGTLTVSNGGAVSATTIFIGSASGSVGTLNIGAAPGSAAAAPGTVDTTSVVMGSGAATINFNHTSTAYSFDAAISGTGSLHVLSGTTILSAVSTFSGTTTISDGKLVVNGSIANSDVVMTGGILGGNGTVGTLLAGAGATVAPGNSIGTLNVAGNVTFAAGSIYQVEVNTAGQSDRIVAGGTATINGGTVQVLAGAGNYSPATTYTILTANGGRSGAFDAVTSNLAFLDPTLSYDPNNIYLTLTRNNTNFASIGLTRNQIATGGGVESLGYGNTIYNAVLNLSATQARSAFDQLSGEVHASAKAALIEDSRFVREAAADRLRAAFDTVGAVHSPVMAYAADDRLVLAPATTDRVALWTRGFGSFGRWSGDGNAAALRRDTGGVLIGADGIVGDTWRLGLLGGYSRTGFNVKDRSSSGTSDNYHAGLYGGTRWGDLAFRSGAAYTWHDLSTSRSVSFPGFADRLTGNYNAGTAQVFGEFGYRLKAGRFAFEPFANLAHVNLRTGGFTEKGGAAALPGFGSDTNTTFSTLGLRGSTDVKLGGVTGTAKATFGWRHAFADVSPLSTFVFAGGSPFTIAGVPIARDAAVVDAGLDVNLAAAAVLGVSYGGQFASSVLDQTVRANLNVKF